MLGVFLQSYKSFPETCDLLVITHNLNGIAATQAIHYMVPPSNIADWKWYHRILPCSLLAFTLNNLVLLIRVESYMLKPLFPMHCEM